MLDLKKEQCTGCWACKNACPMECIDMTEDKEGFLYPVIDINKCIECSLCEKACPAINIPVSNNFKEPVVYAAWSLDNEVRSASSSGGIFTELAYRILDNNGFVAGARYNTNSMVEHCLINSKEELYKLRQSKYVQSEIGQIFKDVKMLLEDGRTVMFTGTPCQTAGLLQYLNIKYDNLLLCDIVCHGVNSPLVYSRYFNELGEEHKSKVKKINFRDKRNGWNDFGTCVIFENGKEYFCSQKIEPFYRGFIKNLYLRPSCYSCQYKSFPRLSDITLADFWGINTDDTIDDIYMGVSLIMIHSQKGDIYFNSIKGKITKSKRKIEEALLRNPCIVKPSFVQSEKRDSFFNSLNSDEKLKDIISKII